MISIDTNILFYAFDPDSSFHEPARDFLDDNQSNSQILISELTLVEFYRLLRNPVIYRNPLSAPDAVAVIQSYRSHPNWTIVGFPDLGSNAIHDTLWRTAATPGIAYRRIYDIRLALTLQHFGVTHFATANVKDFQDLGFQRVWNPLTD
jgi:toxin-antitoxin system PIN domain toxin